MIKIKLNGNSVKANEGETVLELAKREGIYIPTLCHNESLKPSGACRLCIVEVMRDKGPAKIVSSCTFLVEAGIEVETNSERVTKNRRMILELLRSRVGESRELKLIAERCGADKPIFNNLNEDCILCGLCVRVCDEVVEAKALSFNSRGTELDVGGPFMKSPEDCIGCGACVYVCPVDCIKMEIKHQVLTIKKWNRKILMRTCNSCGYPFMPDFQAQKFKKDLELDPHFFDLCVDCRK